MLTSASLLTTTLLCLLLTGCNSAVQDSKLSGSTNSGKATPEASSPKAAPEADPEAPPPVATSVPQTETVLHKVPEQTLQDKACSKHVIIDGHTAGPFKCLADDQICEGLFFAKGSSTNVCQRSSDTSTAPPCCDYSAAVGCDGKYKSYASVLLDRKCRSYALGSSSTFCNPRGFCEGMSFSGKTKCLASKDGCALNNDTVVSCENGAPRNLTQESFDANCAGFVRSNQLTGVNSTCDQNRICTGFKINVLGVEKVIDCTGRELTLKAALDNAVCRGLSLSLSKPFESTCKNGLCSNLTYTGKQHCADYNRDGTPNLACLSKPARAHVTCDGKPAAAPDQSTLDRYCKSLTGSEDAKCLTSVNVCQGVFRSSEGYCKWGDAKCDFNSFVTCDGHNVTFGPQVFDKYCNSLGGPGYDGYCQADTFTCKGIHSQKGVACIVDKSKQVSCCSKGDDVRCDGLIIKKKPTIRKSSDRACFD